MLRQIHSYIFVQINEINFLKNKFFDAIFVFFIFLFYIFFSFFFRAKPSVLLHLDHHL